MKIIAHRGVTNRAPENTMTAFLDAARQGYGVECDVRLSKDGVPVIMHDANLKRMAGVGEAVSDLTLAQLQGIQIKHEYPIPTLESVIKHVLPKTFVSFDIKEPPAVQPALRLLKGASATHGMMMAARDDDSVVQLIKNFSESAFIHPLAWVAIRHAQKIDAKSIACRSWYINRRAIKRAITAGLKVYVYGPAPNVEWFKQQGVTGLTKDI